MFNFAAKFQPTESIGTIPRCIRGRGIPRCYSLGYYPDDDANVQQLVAVMVKSNDIPMNEVIGFRGESEANRFVLNNPNETQAVVGFEVDYGCNGSETCHSLAPENRTVDEVLGIRYSLQFNQTLQFSRYDLIDNYLTFGVPLAAAVDDALLQVFGSDAVSAQDRFYRVQLTPYPHPLLRDVNVIDDAGPVIVFGSLMFNFVIQIGKIVMEKERNLRQSMNTMGLKDSVYWFTWLVTNLLFNVISSLLLVVSGCIFQFDIFLLNSFAVYGMLFFLFALCMVSMAFFVSTFLSKAHLATSTGFVIFLIGTIAQGAASRIFQEETPVYYRFIFSFMPFALLAKGLDDLASSTPSEAGGIGFEWADIYDNEWFSMEDVYVWLVINFIVYFALALYFDNVLSGGSGKAKPLWYFLDYRYWTGTPPPRAVLFLPSSPLPYVLLEAIEFYFRV